MFYGMNSCYGMSGMYNPYMMGCMYPQNLEQLTNQRKASTDIGMQQVSFLGKSNPLFSVDKKDKFGAIKDLYNYQADMMDVYNPYSSQNINATKGMMELTSNYQMNAMTNPFALGYGSPVIC